jgi:hypothetical protein
MIKRGQKCVPQKTKVLGKSGVGSLGSFQFNRARYFNLVCFSQNINLEETYVGL